jgi:hypothetical protein
VAEEDVEGLMDVYGLAEDPFAMASPPEPGDRLWCFVDRSLDERSTTRTLRRAVTNFVDRLRGNKAGNRGLMIIGKWGDGKSHSLKAIAAEGSKYDISEIRINVRDDAIELHDLFKKEESLYKATFRLISERGGINISAFDTQTITKALSEVPMIINIDQAEDLIEFEESEFLGLSRMLSGILEYAAAGNLQMGIAIALTPERFRLLQGKVKYVLDRFDKAMFWDDMAVNEACQLIENNLALVRIEEKESRKLYPFTNQSVIKILDIWRTENRTIREFRSKCSKVLTSGAEHNIGEITSEFAANAIHSHYSNWEKCLIDWRELRRKRHRILVQSIFNSLDKCKNLPDIRFDEVIPELTYPVSSDESVRNDIMVIPHGYLPVAIEIELGTYFGKGKYEKIARLVEKNEYSGVVFVALSYKTIIRANKVAMSTLRDSGRFDVVKIEDSTLKLGRTLSFGALSPHLEFPIDEQVRLELQRSIREDDAISLVKEQLPLVKAIDAVKKEAL